VEWQYILLLVIGGIVALMFTGLPVAFCFMAVNLVAIYIMWGGLVGWEQLSRSICGALASFALLPLPLFVLMGELIAHSGFGNDMLNAVDQWLGRLPGRLSFVAVLGGVLLATLTGTNLASVTVLGEVLLPEMKKRGYHSSMSLGPILGSSGLAMMIPPSALAVLLGSIGEISVGQILIAIIMPGLLMAVLIGAYIVGRCTLQSHLAPAYNAPKVPLKKKLIDTSRNVLPVAVIIFLVIGVMFLGIAGPSEAAATGALGTLVVCLALGKLKWGVLKKAIGSTVKITGMMFLIVAGSTAFSQVLAYSQASEELVMFLTGLGAAPIVSLIMMLVVVLILGFFMDSFSIIMITVPIFMPIVVALGYNPVWFAVIYLIAIDAGGLTPPFGMALFAMKGVAPKGTTMGDVIRAGTPFLGLNLLALALIVAFPTIALWLPGAMR
jgi:tripartite ATP-independent transporter DctM subunit